MRERTRIEGTLRVEARRAGGGEVIHARRARNTVIRSGAELVGALFTGAGAPTPVNGMAIGTSPEALSAPYELPGLLQTDRAGRTLVAPTAIAIKPEDVKVESLPAELRVRVSIRGVLPPAAPPAPAPGEPPWEPADIAEAALGVLAPAAPGAPAGLAKIYNRVVFDPIPQSREHELAFYWEISFPYGA